MSMTQKEASRILAYLKDNSCSKAERVAMNMALTALRGPTREMVERMRGEWKHYLPPLGAGNVQCRCTNCGRTPDVETPFCAWCGAPMTDEAVEMMLKRWKEAVDGEQGH